MWHATLSVCVRSTLSSLSAEALEKVAVKVYQEKNQTQNRPNLPADSASGASFRLWTDWAPTSSGDSLHPLFTRGGCD